VQIASDELKLATDDCWIEDGSPVTAENATHVVGDAALIVALVTVRPLPRRHGSKDHNRRSFVQHRIALRV
jgi:hypothetical protein